MDTQQFASEAEREMPKNVNSPVLDKPPTNLKNSNEKMQRNKLIALGIVALCFIIGGVIYWGTHRTKTVKVEAPKEVAAEVGQTENKVDLTLEPLPLPEEASAEAVASEPLAVPEVQPVSGAPATQETGETPTTRKMGGGVLAVDFDKSVIATKDTGGSATATTSKTAGGDTNSPVSDKLRPTLFSPNSAGQRGDTSLMLTRGALIPCVLVSKIVTTYPSITRCQTTKDVYSSNGKTLLLERGSVVMGEQQSALIQGQARVFILWTQVETPKGVVINIDSGGTDNLGGAGHPAFVDTHFWERFGGGILLSLIEDLTGALGNQITAKSADGVTFENSADNASTMAQEAIKNTINIPPTGYVNQGALLTIMVARDLSFKDVYEVVDRSDFSN
jgi:type IV secretion system protein VirB10